MHWSKPQVPRMLVTSAIAVHWPIVVEYHTERRMILYYYRPRDSNCNSMRGTCALAYTADRVAKSWLKSHTRHLAIIFQNGSVQ